MTGDRKIDRMAPVPQKTFAAFMDSKGQKALVEVDHATNTLRYVGKDALASAIAEYHSKLLPKENKSWEELSLFGMADSAFISSHIRSIAPELDFKSIKRVAEKDFAGLCFQRLTFSLNSEEDFPVFREMLDRMTNKDAVMAWIGSLFDDQCDRAQMLVIYGSGGDGKGHLIQFLRNIVGCMGASIDVTAVRGNHWLESVHDKRLITMGECDDFRFVTSGAIKGLTGDDYHLVNPKGQPAFYAEIKCKLFVATNVKPDARSVESNRRRVIFSEFSKPTGEFVSNNRYQQDLAAESAAFLSACWRQYLAACPQGGRIPTDESVYGALTDEMEAGEEDILQEYFVRDERLVLRSVALSALFSRLKLLGGDHHRFANYLSYKHGMKFGQCKKKDQRANMRGIFGLALHGKWATLCDAPPPDLKAGLDDSPESWAKQLRAWGYDSVRAEYFQPAPIEGVKEEKSPAQDLSI